MEVVWLTSWQGGSDGMDERREEGTERGNEGRPSRPHNKFSRVGLVKLCAAVILLSAGVIEGHQTID